MQGLTPLSRIFPTRTWCLPRPPCGCAACGANWIMLWCGSRPATCWLALEPLGRDSGASQCQVPVTDPGLLVWIYQEMCSLWLLLPRGMKDPSRVPRLASTSTEARDRSAIGSKSPKTCLHCWLPARLSHRKSLLCLSWLSVSHEVVGSEVHQVDRVKLSASAGSEAALQKFRVHQC